MRKLFRFKYEPCNKTCYAWCQKLTKELRALSETERNELVTTMVKAHNRLCDNPDYSFGLDVDEKSGMFVSHFRKPQSTDLFASSNFSNAIESVCSEVMKHDIPKVNADCNFGDNGAEDLGREILKFCTDVGYAQIQDTHCECKAYVS